MPTPWDGAHALLIADPHFAPVVERVGPPVLRPPRGSVFSSLAAAIGGTSGQQMDKFEKLSIRKEKPSKTTAPILEDAYAAYECKLLDSKPYGDHIWIVGEIVAVHFKEEAFTAAEVLDMGKIRPLLYLGSDLYASIDKDSVNFVKRGI